MKSKTLAIAVIEKSDTILMRKKPSGSKPYDETWYLFGVEIDDGQNPKTELINYLKDKVGIEVSIEKILDSSGETKTDYDGEIKKFQYKNHICKYISGQPILPANTEKIEWVQINNLSKYDLVPPSKILLNSLYSQKYLL